MTDGYSMGISILMALTALPSHTIKVRCRQLLRFCTALEVLPDAGHPQGLATRPITVRPWDAGTADGSEARAGAALGRLPRASTCTRELWLPQYSSAEMLEQRLAAAVESLDAEAFHLV